MRKYTQEYIAKDAWGKNSVNPKMNTFYNQRATKEETF